MNAKIFVVCHDPEQIDERLFRGVYVPVCVGARKDEFPPYFLRDDEGENIADENSTFNEMTAIYRVFRNLDELGNPDVIGFVHYRRFFAFSNDAKNYEERTEFDDEFFREIETDDAALEKLFSKYDYIAPLPAYRKSVEENYEKAHGDDLKIVGKTIDENYPEFAAAKNEYFKGNKAYFFNMFVFKRETFERYCNLVFPVLFECREKMPDKSERLFVSERLTGVFFTELEKEGQKECCLPVTCVIKNAKLKDSLKKAKQNGKSSLLYAIKPVVEKLTPRRVMLAYRRKKYDKFSNMRAKI